jgi:hypothetical protein
LVIYHTKNLCHHIKHILFYFWSKYGAIWRNIASFVKPFLIKLCSGTRFLSHLLEHLKTCSNQEVYEYLMKKENLSNKLFCKSFKVMFWERFLGWDIPLCTLTVNVPIIYMPSYLFTNWIHDTEINLNKLTYLHVNWSHQIYKVKFKMT